MRQAEGASEVLVTLLDAAGPFCGGAAVVRVDNGRFASARVRGASPEVAAGLAGLDLPLSAAAALAGAADSRDPVTAVASPAELSPEVSALVPQADGAKVSVYPVVSADAVRALLVCWGALQGGTLELLVQAAGLAWPVEKAMATASGANAELLSIAPVNAPAASARTSKAAWEDLPAEQQRIHLSAQRFARVRAAELRLHQAEAVQAGRVQRDIYGAVRHEIDEAREKFRRTFVETCPSMVDYLHIELVRTLANDNIAFMGSDYPGPLA
jgi:hypothetical protein